MRLSEVKKSNLKDLGDIHWKDVINKNYYHEQLLYNRFPDKKITKGIDKEACSNTRVRFENAPCGIKFTIVFDREFLINKAITHLFRYFDSKKELDEFINEAWHYNENNSFAKAKKISNSMRGNLSLSKLKKLPLDEVKDVLKIYASELDLSINFEEKKQG